MIRFGSYFTFGVLSVCLIVLPHGTTSAMPPFKIAFMKKYTDKDKDKAFFDMVRKANCNICHVKGESDKSIQNEYGQALANEIKGSAKERLDAAKQTGQTKEETAKLLKELDAGFDVVAKKEKTKGVTWGDVIRKPGLPVPVPTEEKAANTPSDGPASTPVSDDAPVKPTAATG